MGQSNSAKETIKKIFDRKLPSAAVDYAMELWIASPFNFQLSRNRQSKLGDFRYRRDAAFQTITINNNLNPFQFLITYIHEVAHHKAYLHYGLSIKPHGKEWKMIFQKLMFPMLNSSVFPQDILVPLRHHMKNPKASSGADFWLIKELRKYDKDKSQQEPSVYLNDLGLGNDFDFQGRRFKKISSRRTRVLCQEVHTGREYLISGHAEILPVLAKP